MTGAPADPPPVLALRSVAKHYGRAAHRHSVLEGVDFALADGEFVAVVGYSGSGKTTLLSLLAGLVEPDAGRVEMDGAPARGPSLDRGIVFQSYALLPWLTALGNVQISVDAAHGHWSHAKRRAHAEHYVRLVGLYAAR